MIKKIVPVMMILLTLNLFAKSGGDQSHGGDGWLDDNGKPWLYDLKEGNLHLNPYFDSDIKSDRVVSDELKIVISFVDDKAASLFSRKLAEIYSIHPDLAAAILVGMKKYQWYASDTLLDIKDEDPILNIPAERQVQLAARKGSEIFIDQKWWKMLTPENQVALIFHEILYAWISPEYFFEEGVHFEKQSSTKVRSVVRYIFSENLKRRGAENFKRLLKQFSFPEFKYFSSFYQEHEMQKSLEFLNVKIESYLKNRNPVGYNEIQFLLPFFDEANNNWKAIVNRNCSALQELKDKTNVTNIISSGSYRIEAKVNFLSFLTRSGNKATFLSYKAYEQYISKRELLASFDGVDPSTCVSLIQENLKTTNNH